MPCVGIGRDERAYPQGESRVANRLEREQAAIAHRRLDKERRECLDWLSLRTTADPMELEHLAMHLGLAIMQAAMESCKLAVVTTQMDFRPLDMRPMAEIICEETGTPWSAPDVGPTEGTHRNGKGGE